MGQWTIVIQGTGAHHNRQYKSDANRMTAAFVQQLRDAGHDVRHATFSSSSEEDVSPGTKYLAERDEIEKS